MELKDQLTSLEPSRRLKELGVKQDSQFGWVKGITPKGKDLYHIIGVHIRLEHETFYSAYSVAELCEMLPERLYVNKLPYWMHIIQQEGYEIAYVEGREEKEKITTHDEKKLADALALMLIQLIKSKLITIKD